MITQIFFKDEFYCRHYVDVISAIDTSSYIQITLASGCTLKFKKADLREFRVKFDKYKE